MSTRRQGLRLGAEPVRFRFDGREIQAQRGDSAASALLACGVRLTGRSVKYRRARGIFTAGCEEPNALFTVGAAPQVIPNVPGPQLAVHAGLEVRSQNRWPSLRFDAASLLQLGGGFLGAGFYYKTFMWPSWRAYEGIIRRLAGLGEAPGAGDLSAVEVEHLDTDVLVAGAGPAGLAAALAAARAGSRVVLCEREVACGGELEFESAAIAGRSAAQWIAEVLRELGALGARVLTQTAVVFGSGGLVLAHRQRGGLPGADAMYRIRPRALVVAMGALERPIAFLDNDLPGVMLLGAAERYLARYGVRVGASPVLFGNHDRMYAAAARLLDAGVRVRAIVDTRDDAAAQSSGRERDELRRAGIECRTAHAVLAAQGRLAVRAASIAPLASPGTLHEIACDTILVSGGWSPAVHAGLHEDGNPAFEPGLGAFVAAGQSQWRSACGAAAGHLEIGAVLSDAYAAGQRAARASGATGDAGTSLIARGDAAPHLAPFWRSPANLSGEKRQFVDLQNDVTVADLRQALEEGFRDIEHVKRYTTLGVGTEQGRTASVLGAAIVAELLGTSLAATGMSRTRPPYQPVTLMAICGARVGAALRPERRTPLHDCHVQQGGVLEPAGLWLRPRFYLANGAEPFQAGVAEAARVRSHGGIFDGSTLGKIEVAGPDAAALLDRLYLTRASTIKIGRAKYMVNLREDGMVLDDGLVLRLAPDRFLATTSSGHAGHMLSHFEFWRAHFGGHAATLTDVTEAWAVIVVAGPQGRERLAEVLGAEWRERLLGLAHMDFASGHWSCPNEFGPTEGRELRVLRASFSGELAFELHCRPRIAPALWQALIRTGLAPYGLEALDILRIEKGYLVDAEINGQTTPRDLGMDGLLKLDNSCVGRELLEREAFRHPDRPRLVGLRAADGRSQFLAGAQITALDASAPAGHVTSSAYSPALKQWIGLALVARRLAREGDEIMARDPLRGSETRVTVVPPVHFDPASERMKA